MFSPSHHPTAGVDPAAHVDLTNCTLEELSYFLAGVLHGTLTKAERDAETEARHAAALHSRARSVLRAMASIPERDEMADARRADERAAWWADRRGERRPA